MMMTREELEERSAALDQIIALLWADGDWIEDVNSGDLVQDVSSIIEPFAKAQPCPRCDGTGTITVCGGGNPDNEYLIPCPAKCGNEPPEEDPRTAEEIRDAATFAETHGGEL